MCKAVIFGRKWNFIFIIKALYNWTFASQRMNCATRKLPTHQFTLLIFFPFGVQCDLQHVQKTTFSYYNEHLLVRRLSFGFDTEYTQSHNTPSSGKKKRFREAEYSFSFLLKWFPHLCWPKVREYKHFKLSCQRIEVAVVGVVWQSSLLCWRYGEIQLNSFWGQFRKSPRTGF